MIDIKEVGRIYETGGLWKEKTCYISGEHFKDGEKLVINKIKTQIFIKTENP